MDKKADPALTIDDLEPSKKELYKPESILKKPTELPNRENKKVLFTQKSLSEIAELETDQDSKTNQSSNTQTETGSQTVANSQSLKELSQLDSGGLLSSHKKVNNAQDLKWKINSILQRRSFPKRYDQSPSEIFRQRLNSYYERELKRFAAFDVKPPPKPQHLSTFGTKNSACYNTKWQ